jgi:hypothetical protein
VRGFLKGQMGVGAVGADVADTCVAAAAAGPRAALGDDREAACRTVGERSWSGGGLAVVQGERGLHQAYGARRRLEVTEVGRGGADAQRLATATSEHSAERLGLNRITQRRADAVRLDVGDVPETDAGVLPSGAQHIRPDTGPGPGTAGPGTGSRRPVAGAVMADGTATDHGVDTATGGEGVGQPTKRPSNSGC